MKIKKEGRSRKKGTAPGKKKTSESVSNPDRNTGSSATTWKYIFTAEQGTYAFGFV